VKADGEFILYEMRDFFIDLQHVECSMLSVYPEVRMSLRMTCKLRMFKQREFADSDRQITVT